MNIKCCLHAHQNWINGPLFRLGVNNPYNCGLSRSRGFWRFNRSPPPPPPPPPQKKKKSLFELEHYRHSDEHNQFFSAFNVLKSHNHFINLFSLDSPKHQHWRFCVNIVCNKYFFLISQPKHMLWGLKRTVSGRRFF